MATLGNVVAWLAMFVVGTVLAGFIAAQFWLWFVVPVFGVAPITFAEAAGLSFLASYLRGARDIKGSIWVGFGRSIVWALASLFFGWLIHLWATSSVAF